MTREEIIQGLQFTIDMFLSDPLTGEPITKPRNDMDKTTIDACKGAIELLTQEPCEDTISRADAINKVTNFYTNCERLKMFRHTSNEVKQTVTDILCDLPPVTPKPKMGHWILDETDNSITCDKCGCLIYANDIMHGEPYYCPNCGARMVEPQESENKG